MTLRGLALAKVIVEGSTIADAARQFEMSYNSAWSMWHRVYPELFESIGWDVDADNLGVTLLSYRGELLRQIEALTYRERARKAGEAGGKARRQRADSLRKNPYQRTVEEHMRSIFKKKFYRDLLAKEESKNG